MNDTTEIVRQLRRQGWRVVKGTRHFKAYPPDAAQRMITIPASPSDHRWRANLRADLRRAGAKL